MIKKVQVKGRRFFAVKISKKMRLIQRAIDNGDWIIKESQVDNQTIKLVDYKALLYSLIGVSINSKTISELEGIVLNNVMLRLINTDFLPFKLSSADNRSCKIQYGLQLKGIGSLSLYFRDGVYTFTRGDKIHDSTFTSILHIQKNDKKLFRETELKSMQKMYICRNRYTLEECTENEIKTFYDLL